jgi:glycine/D-amino acid oxidase-like deaminating enzyme
VSHLRTRRVGALAERIDAGTDLRHTARMTAAASVSHWFAALDGEAVPARPRLEAPREADVCVVGAGYTGLWTAYELRRADPSLDVVVLEREHVGYGASGRNGGWLSGELGGSHEHWAARGGREGALALRRAIEQTVDAVGAIIEREEIDCDFLKAGSIEVAQTTLQLQRLHARHAAERAWLPEGEDAGELLDATALAERIAIGGALGGRFSPHCARIQPAKLVTGLAAAAERAGATLYERTPVTSIGPRVAHTPHGDVRARWIVRATEAYSAELPGLRRTVVPINSAMIVTEPLDAATWASIGWMGQETLIDGAHMYVYLQRTVDGRIAIGGRGVPYRYGSRTEREGAVPQRTVDDLRGRLSRLFPTLERTRLDGAWHGVLGMARDWAPAVGADPASGDAWAVGYGGEGVAAAHLAARTLRDLILGERSALTALPWVGRPSRRWEPEPLRFVGIRGVYALLAAADATEARTGRPSRAAALAERLAGRS